MNKTVKKSVIEEIIQNDLCIGCGLCAGVCPSRFLRMDWNKLGELKPEQSDCIDSCNLCLEVCPFSNHKSELSTIPKDRFGCEHDIQYRYETGYFKKVYVGHVLDNNVRMQCSSGGMTTWLLKILLEDSYVDRVICVTNQNSLPEKLFTFQIIEDPMELGNARGSRYYPVDLSEVITKVLADKTDKEYAIVGLPCQLFGISLAIQKIPKLRKRIRVIIGLVCGHLPNKFYTEFLTLRSGIKPENTQTVNYRGKVGIKTADNFTFQAFSKTGEAGKIIDFTSEPYRLWSQDFFTHNACNYCDDVFAEVADITFMDAWEKEYTSDVKGNSYILVRANWLNDLLNQNKQKEIFLHEVGIDKVIESQKGVIEKKKSIIQGQIWFAHVIHQQLLGSRQKSDFNFFLKNCTQIIIKRRIQVLSKIRWQKSNKSNPQGFLNSFKCEEIILKFANLSKRVKNKIGNKKGLANQ